MKVYILHYLQYFTLRTWHLYNLWFLCKSSFMQLLNVRPYPWYNHWSRFLHARCPSCCTTNSVEALKEMQCTGQLQKFTHWTSSLPDPANDSWGKQPHLLSWTVVLSNMSVHVTHKYTHPHTAGLWPLSASLCQWAGSPETVSGETSGHLEQLIFRLDALPDNESGKATKALFLHMFICVSVSCQAYRSITVRTSKYWTSRDTESRDIIRTTLAIMMSVLYNNFSHNQTTEHITLSELYSLQSTHKTTSIY